MPEPTETVGMDIVVPPTVLGGLASVGLVIFSGVGCYAYYPPASRSVRRNPHRQRRSPECRTVRRCHSCGILDRRVSGMDPKTGSRHLSANRPIDRLSAAGRHRLVREQLEMLKHTVEDGESEEARQWVSKVQRSHRRMRSAFLSVSNAHD